MNHTVTSSFFSSVPIQIKLRAIISLGLFPHNSVTLSSRTFWISTTVSVCKTGQKSLPLLHFWPPRFLGGIRHKCHECLCRWNERVSTSRGKKEQGHWVGSVELAFNQILYLTFPHQLCDGTELSVWLHFCIHIWTIQATWINYGADIPPPSLSAASLHDGPWPADRLSLKC